jgi:hypothetical protein
LATEELIALSQLESELGISRVDLLLVMRRLGIDLIRRGMRTLLRSADAERLKVHLDKAETLETITAELVLENSGGDGALPVPVAQGWEKAEQFAGLKVLHERLQVLEHLQRTGIELDTAELCQVLELRRPPTLVRSDSGMYFERMGLRFQRMNRAGQRSSWRVSGSGQ